MHVAIDGVGNHVGGGWSVLTRTVRHLSADDRLSRISVFCSPLDLAPSQVPQHPKVHWLQHPWAHETIGRLGWLRHWLDQAVSHVGADVVLTLNGAGRTSYPNVVLVQQAFLVWGKLRRVRPRTLAAKLVVLRREMAKAIHGANAVVVQTSWMRERIRHALGRDATVLPLGLPGPYDEDLPGESGHIVVVGSDLPYKRHEVARRAVELAGKHRALRLETIDDTHPDDVPPLLASAGALIVASDVESFGLPVVEAFAAGCPVVLTDRPWSRSVGGDAAAYFEHATPASAASRILTIASDPTYAAELRERGRARIAALWESEPYAQLVDLLEEVA